MADLNRGWQDRKSLAQCNAYMLENGIACDVKIKCHTQDGKVVMLQAHKYILVSRSPVFEAMFCGSYQESSDSIEITDIEPDVFKEVLRFMYSEEVQLTVDNILHIVFAAKKYFIGGLVDEAEQFLEDNLSESNVCTVLTNSLYYMDSNLSTKCLCYIAKRVEAVFNSEDFLSLSQEGLCAILQYNDIKLKSELNMFEHCLKWATFQIGRESKDVDKLRTTLGECVHQIRFHLMTSKEIAENVTQSGVLRSDELLALFCHLAAGNQEASLEKFGFNIQSRNKHLSDFTQWMRFGSTEHEDVRWHYDGELDCISFKTNQNILVHGICIYGGYFKGDIHTVSIKLFDAGSQECQQVNKAELVSNGTDEPVAVFFDKAVSLQADLWHGVALMMNGPDTFFGESGNRVVMVDGIELTFADHPDDVNGTDVYSGQIPMIIFTAAENT